jgi:tetratricopeptide (TPR) repeat protein
MKTALGNRRGLGVILCLLLWGTLILQPILAVEPVDSGQPAALFYRANEFYQKGAYREAIASYRRVLGLGFESGNLYYNLGNAYFKTGRKGWAILYYEKARNLLPGDSDLRANLNYASAGIPEGDRGRGFRDWLTHLAPLHWLLIITSGCFFLLAGLGCAAILRPEQFWAKTSPFRSRWVGAAILVGMLVLAGMAISGLTLVERNRTWAIALEQCEARFEPSPGGTVYYRLPEGARLEILSTRSGWTLVRRGDGRQGWVPRREVARI